ncbi:MAG: N-acetyltransferase [Saprospiraceae bacterium]|nr:N-acetyltransferase [Saprospiraceae bacterium]
MKTLFQKSGYTFRIASSIGELRSEWDRIQPSSLLLSSEFLQTIELYRPQKVQFKYAVAEDHKGLAAAFYFQLLPFNAAERLKLKSSRDERLISCFYKHVKRLIASQVDFVTLVCGNLLATGAYGFKYRKDLDMLVVQDMIDQLLKALFEEPELIHKASVCLIKELPAKNAFRMDQDLPLNFMHPFFVQPSMILHLKEEWSNFDEYLDALQSKYRLRLRKAMDAAASLEHVELQTKDIQLHEKELFEFYKRTADNADFNLVDLHPQYFSGLKSKLGDKFRVFGFFSEGSLIAFYSFIDDGDELVGHFLGTSDAVNGQYQLYLNILIQFIRHSISGRFKTLSLARTALEIKSSVGALPEEMVCYVTHRNKIYNRWVPNLLEYLKPQKNYTLRTPFKTGGNGKTHSS